MQRGRVRVALSVIQRPQAVESSTEAHMPNSGRVRVALSSVILAQRGSPMEGRSSTTTVDAETHHLRHSEAAGRGIPHGGATQYIVATMA